MEETNWTDWSNNYDLGTGAGHATSIEYYQHNGWTKNILLLIFQLTPLLIRYRGIKTKKDGSTSWWNIMFKSGDNFFVDILR